MYQGNSLKEARTIRTSQEEGRHGIQVDPAGFQRGKDRTKIKGGDVPPDLEFEFLACLASAATERDRSIIDIVSQTVKPEYIEDRGLREIFEALIQHEDLDLVYQKIKKKRRKLFLTILGLRFRIGM